MMNIYAHVIEGRVLEVIAPFADDDGVEVPVEQRFTAEFVAELVLVPEGQSVAQGDTYVDGAFGPAPVPPAQPMSTEEARGRRDALLAQAALRIAPLQDASDLGEATAVELGSLKAWKQYRVALSRLDCDKPNAIEWPRAPV